MEKVNNSAYNSIRNGRILMICLIIVALVSLIFSINFYSKLKLANETLRAAKNSLFAANDSLLSVEKQMIELNDSLTRSIIIIGNLEEDIEKNKIRLNEIYKIAIFNEKKGFESIINNDFEGAIFYFGKAENLLPSIHYSFEIRNLLNGSRHLFNEASGIKKIKDSIVSNYSYGIPTELENKLKAQLNQ